MATKRQRDSGSWEFVFRRKGLLRKPVSLTFSTEAEGDQFASRAEAALDQGIILPALQDAHAPIAKFRDAVEQYKLTISLPNSDELLIDLAAVEHYDLRLSDINYDWITKYVNEMKLVKKLAPSTIRHKVGAMARCFDWCILAGHMGANPLRGLRKGYASYSERDAENSDGGRADTERDRRLEEGEEDAIRKILGGAKPEGKQRPLTLEHGYALLMLFELALESAMRMKEMYTLTIDQIDFAKKTIFLDKTKNGDKRQVPMTSVTMDRLHWYLESERETCMKQGGLVFPWLWEEAGGLVTKLSYRRVTSLLSRQYVRIFKSAGCVDLKFHDLRHEATSRIYERTSFTDLRIAKITGHRTLNTLKRYANLRASDSAGQMW